VSVKLPSELAVLMHGQQIATLHRRSRSQPLKLRYQDDLPPGTTPLSVAMPTVVSTHAGPQVRYWLAGLLPDRGEVLAAWRRTFKVTSVEEYALLPHVGADLAGAAQICLPEMARTLNAEGVLVPLSDEQVGERLAELADSSSGWGVQQESGQFSLAGTQAKLALHFDGEHWFLPTGAQPTTHILKPAIRDLPDQDLNEHLTMLTAAYLGLPVPATRVTTFAGRRALVVQRYDRLTREGHVYRIHQEDLVQALGRRPSDKYEASGGPGLLTLVDLLRRVISPENVAHDVATLLDAVAFNWLTAGTDAHARNYSLLLAGPQVRFAPLYDLNSFLPYSSRAHVEMSMSIGGSGHFRSTDVTADDWRWVGRRAQVDPEDLLQRIATMAARLPDAAADAVKAGGIDEVTAATRAFAARFVEALTSHAQQCAAQLKS
jgi:serine/threonine-protein kinase HipA